MSSFCFSVVRSLVELMPSTKGAFLSPPANKGTHWTADSRSGESTRMHPKLGRGARAIRPAAVAPRLLARAIESTPAAATDGPPPQVHTRVCPRGYSARWLLMHVRGQHLGAAAGDCRRHWHFVFRIAVRQQRAKPAHAGWGARPWRTQHTRLLFYENARRGQRLARRARCTRGGLMRRKSARCAARSGSRGIGSVS